MTVGLLQFTSTPAAPLWTPASLSGLVAWYDAADAASVTQSSGAVSQWADKSGHGYHLTQATGSMKPVWSATSFQSNAPGITFDGVDDVLASVNTVAMGGGNAMTAYVLLKQPPLGSSSPQYLIGFQEASDTDLPTASALSVLLVATPNGSPNDLIGRRNNAQIAAIASTSNGYNIGPLNDYYYGVGSVWDGANQTLSINQTVKTATASTGVFGTTGKILIGARSDGAFGWKSSVKDIIILNRAATAAELVRMQAYSWRAWPRVIVCEGDSITHGLPSYIWSSIPSLSPAAYVHNMAIPGSRLNTNGPAANNPGDLVIRAAAHVDAGMPAAVDQGSTKYIFFNAVGTNDQQSQLTIGGASAYASAIVSYNLARKAAGNFWKTGIATILPRTDGASDDTTRNAYNSIITTPGWTTSNGIDFVVDFTTDAIMNANGSPTSNPTYWLDTVHPNGAGHTRLEPIFRAAINAL